MADYQQVIDRIYTEVGPMWPKATPASYIPALAEADPSRFGIAIRTLAGETFTAGQADTPFSIQSISKVFTFAMVARLLGDSIWESVGREPSGTAFNSLVQLEYEQGRPRNPFINAGALVVTDRLIELYPRPKEAILDFVRSVTGNPDIYFDNRIARSELNAADRNLALAHLMKRASATSTATSTPSWTSIAANAPYP